MNTFAFGLTGADRFLEAHRCYLEIGDTLVTRGPWSYRNGNVAKAFLQWRDYIEDAVEKLDGGTAESH